MCRDIQRGVISAATVIGITPTDQSKPTSAATGDTEMVIEAYYKYITADGKLQITPHLQYIGDPGVGATLTETSLFVLGVRIYVPF